MATKRNQYSEDHVRLRLKTSEDPEVQKYLREYFSKYKEPRADYMQPEVRGEDTVTVTSNGHVIGDVYQKDESLYYNNYKNARRTYLDISEDEETGLLICDAIIVVKAVITDADLKKAKKSKDCIFVAFTVLTLTMAVLGFVRGQLVDGIFFTAITPLVVYLGFFKMKDRYESFLPRYQRDQGRRRGYGR